MNIKKKKEDKNIASADVANVTITSSKVSSNINIPDEWEGFIYKLKKGSRKRIMVVDPPDSGKSPFCRAVSENVPSAATIDMDPGQQNIAIPGAVGAEIRSSFVIKRFW